MIRELRLEIFGRVQGVGFRDAVRKFAFDNDLRGFVRNRDDGSVLLVAQGEKKKLHELLHKVQSNPGMPGLSQVAGMSFYWQDIKEPREGFEIVREKSFIEDQIGNFIGLGKKLVGKEDKKVPEHITIIPDGNRRWAREKGMKAYYGHYKGGSYGHMDALFNEAKKLGVKYMSFWGFSTENWNRNKDEIKAIFNLVLSMSEKFRKDAHKNKIRFRHIGRKDRLPKKLLVELEKLEKETAVYSDFNVQLCLDYGGRDEIMRAVNDIVKEGKRVNEKKFVEFLDTFGIPDPDLIIRTSGENRTSGMMPFQSVYAELYFSDLYFPDFDAFELRKAVEEFSRRVRRFGGTAIADLRK
jgi:undecaprenyl diphosphate synthase